MIIHGHEYALTMGASATLSLAYSQTNDPIPAGDTIPEDIRDEFYTFVLGLALAGALNVPYTPPAPPLSTLALDDFYFIYTKQFPESFNIDLSYFYNVKFKSYLNLKPADLGDLYKVKEIHPPTSYVLDLADVYQIEVHYPEEE